MTHLALVEEWTVDGTDLSTWAVLVRSATGADSFPDLRGDDEAVPGVRGRRYRAKVEDSRRISLALFVAPADASDVLVEPTEREQARANLDALVRIFAVRRLVTLGRKMPDGSTRTALAEVVSADPTKRYGGSAFGLVVDFQLADPFFYGDEISSTTATPASPTDFSIDNVGTVVADRLVLDFLGPISNPRLANLTLDPAGLSYVEALVTVAAGEHLLIDTGRWTALNDGDEAIGSIRHSGAFVFFRLAPGPNSLRVTASSPGGSLTVTFDPPYI